MCLISGWCFCDGVLILLIGRPSPRGHWRDDIRTRRSCRFDRRVQIYPNPNAATRPCQGGDQRHTIRTGSLYSNDTRTWSSSCLFHVDAHHNCYEQKEGWHGYPPIMHVRSAGCFLRSGTPDRRVQVCMDTRRSQGGDWQVVFDKYFIRSGVISQMHFKTF
jgi:hypothetical protein